MVIWKRSSATSLAKTSIAPSMLIRSRRSVTQSGLRGALSSFGARAEQISIRRFQTRWNGAVSFLPSLERCSRLQNRSRTCVRRERRPVARESLNFETTTTTTTARSLFTRTCKSFCRLILEQRVGGEKTRRREFNSFRFACSSRNE